MEDALDVPHWETQAWSTHCQKCPERYLAWHGPQKKTHLHLTPGNTLIYLAKFPDTDEQD